MKALNILEKLATKGGVVGESARICKSNEEKTIQFLKECYEMSYSESICSIWGTDLVNEIRRYVLKKFPNLHYLPFEEKLVLNKIKQIRRKKSIKQEVIANYLGVTQSCYSKLEKGESCLTLNHLLQISNFFNLEIKDIVDNLFESPEEEF